ncbi:MAG: ChbG/HpnK family deacetylase [Opitutaceae bacterium]|jgi:hypothetical protein
MIPKQLLIRVDDAGLNDETNRGIEAALRVGVARSVGIMACAPCFKEAAVRLKTLTHSVSVGVHLTLNSEWTGYRWKPLLPVSEVSSLVDTDGFLPRNHQFYHERPPLLDHVVAELRAQIAAVLSTGLTPCYADEHMVFSASSPWMLDPIREIAGEAGLIYDRALNLARFPKGADSIENITEGLRSAPDGRTLLIAHPAEDGPHMRLLGHDRNPPGGPARERSNELATLTDPRLSTLLSEHGVQPIGYADLR